ncbi:uncharacterized protein LOC127789963 isoform X2 [Diospyros lotus]|uniref:uncharacterized protein LOC127789963 isoform X2 n=1 Tax=Diospyros lotus TaxID=55363 RepID=UPI00225646C5|nr:uncharacterized protein LOC127789963 isoform X2 [Diospyros lotus]
MKEAAGRATTAESMEEPKQNHRDRDCDRDRQETEDTGGFTAASDICQQLLQRYGKSSAPQHRHICATAAATRSIIESESLPLVPLSYFAAAINAIEASQPLDTDAVSALLSFLAIVLPLVPEKSILPSKAADAMGILVGLEDRGVEATATARAVVNCLGSLLGFYDLENWNSVKLGLESLLKFSTDRRPKVRKCAQDWVLKVFKLFESTTVIKEASKLVLSLLKGHMRLAVEKSALAATGLAKNVTVSKPEHLEVIHMLTLLKHIVPYLSVKVTLKVLSLLHKHMSAHFSSLTRQTLGVIEVILETAKPDIIILEAENIVKCITSYVCSGTKNPNDTILSAANLLRHTLDKLQTVGVSQWTSNVLLVFGCIAGLLTSEESIASPASDILKELINFHIRRDLLTIDNEPVNDEVESTMESSAVKSACSIIENVLGSCGRIPNVHILAVISVLFHKLGDISYFFMKDTILKLADIITLACRNKSNTEHLQKCIGSAVMAIGPEKILTLLPINPDGEDLSSSNVWLIPILRNYVVGSSLRFFMDHIVPLAESFEHGHASVKQSTVREDLQAYAHSCWGLLPAFCRHPNDTYKNIGSLTKLLITFLTKDSFMLENIAIALQELVNENKNALRSDDDAVSCASFTKTSEVNESSMKFEMKLAYSKKIASRNMRALASCSEELLHALVDIFFASPPEKRACLKDAIRCLASISDSSVTRRIFTSFLERFPLTNDLGKFGKLESDTKFSADLEQGNTASRKDANRWLTVELASCLLEGASEDLVSSIFDLVKQTLQESEKIGQTEAYHTLSRILEEHSWFCFPHVSELVDFLIGLKSPANIAMLRSRLACFQILLAHTVERNLEDGNSKVFHVLNEIILIIKDIMGYLSGTSPHITSGAVSMLSVLVYNDAQICVLVPDLVPSVLALLQTKAVEVIKSVLGFLKVLVSCHQAKDILNLLPDICSGVLPWSLVSRHHFRSKVSVILEIMIRKCGSLAVESVTPEKHRNFVKSILQTRHGKTSSKENGPAGADREISEFSNRGRQLKRKHKDLGIAPEQNGKATLTNRKTDNIMVKKAGNFNHDGLNQSQSRGSARNKRKYNRDPAASGDGQVKKTQLSKNLGLASRRPKNKKVARKQQRNQRTCAE